MSVASNEEGKKWIQASLAVVCILLGYVLVSFFEKMAEWFALEAVIPSYSLITQVLSFAVAGAT
jgi:protein-S-isoprenylcysteine O-methyltransferase Ste14